MLLSELIFSDSDPEYYPDTTTELYLMCGSEEETLRITRRGFKYCTGGRSDQKPGFPPTPETAGNIE